MKIRELYPDVITEDLNYEYKTTLNPDKPIKWAKTIIGFANDKGGTIFVEALSFIERNTKTGWRKTTNGGREEVRSYPKEAVREALVNTIAHRDYSISGTQIDVDIYSDRIEIVSPGSWLLPFLKWKAQNR